MTVSGAPAPTRFAPIPGPAQMGKDFLYLVLGLPVGIAAFTFAVTAVSVSLGLAITLVGIPLALITLLGTRWIAKLERERARLVVDAPAAPRDRPLEGGLLDRSR